MGADTHGEEPTGWKEPIKPEDTLRANMDAPSKIHDIDLSNPGIAIWRKAESNNNCQGEWLNDCPYVECKCALKVLDDMHEQEEDYDDQVEATSKGLIFWIAVFAVIVILGFLALGGLIF